MNSHRFLPWSTAVALLVAASSASAIDFFNPQNGHHYRALHTGGRLPNTPIVSGFFSWDAARGVAFSQTHNGLRGHLVTITDSAEQSFIENLPIKMATIWLGGFQPAGGPEPDGNWQWVTGEPFSYSNWARFEPNDYYGEDLIEMWAGSRVGSQYWNDVSATHHAGNPHKADSPQGRRLLLIEFTPGYSPKLTGADFLSWQRNFGWPTYGGNFNWDGLVDAADLQIWQTAGFVPEPATATLLIIAIGFFQAVRRVRKSPVFC